MSYKRRVGSIFAKLVKCMDNNDLSSFLNILNKHQSNVDLEFCDKETGHTLLTYACDRGLFDFIKTLIQSKGADINHCNAKSQNSPLHFATSSNNGVILKFLMLNGADIFQQNKVGLNALDYSLAMDHRTSYEELRKIVDRDCCPPTARPVAKNLHKVSKSGPDRLFDRLECSRIATTDSFGFAHIQDLDIPESPGRLISEHGLRLKQSQSERSAEGRKSGHKPYSKRFSDPSGSGQCRSLSQHEEQRQGMLQRIQTIPLCGGASSVGSTTTLFSKNGRVSCHRREATNGKTHSGSTPFMSPKIVVSSRRKSRRFGSFSKKNNRKDAQCKSCVILHREVAKLRAEREVLERKVRHSVHGLVLQKELVRKQEVELRILRAKVQAMLVRHTPSAESSRSTSRSVGVENEQYFVEDFIVDNELDMLSDSPPVRGQTMLTDEERDSAEEATDFSFAAKTNAAATDDDEKENSPPLALPPLFAMVIEREKTAAPTSRKSRRRAAWSKFPAASSAPNLRACHSNKPSVQLLAQSVTESVVQMADDEKSMSSASDHYDEEWMETMPPLPARDDVRLTTSGNVSGEGVGVQQSSCGPPEGAQFPSGLLSPLSIRSVRSADAGMDSDLLRRLVEQSPTPSMLSGLGMQPPPSLSLQKISVLDASDSAESNVDAECLETQQSERWQLFQRSELFQLFQVLQFRTYCYCRREKRTSQRLRAWAQRTDSVDSGCLAAMEGLHSAAIAEELLILRPILNIDTLSLFLRQLVATERALDVLFNPHQLCHDAVYESIAGRLGDCGIPMQSQPVFNWAVSDYQQMAVLQQRVHRQFEHFLLRIARQLHSADIYCCHRDDFDAENKYRRTVTPATSALATHRRTEEDTVNDHYRSRFGDDFDPKHTVFTATKNRERTFFKVHYDFDGDAHRVTDFLRASFVFDNFEDLYSALFVIHHFCEKETVPPPQRENGAPRSRPSTDSAKMSNSGGILKFKNSFLPQSKLNNGWRQIVLNVPFAAELTDDDGQITTVSLVCEIQLHFALFWQLKDDTHRMYEISRLFKICDPDTGSTKNLAMECAKQFYGGK